MRTSSLLATALFGVCFFVANALGTVLVLKNGGRLEGAVSQRTENSDVESVFYIVRLDSGARIKINGREVRRVIEDPPEHQQYAKLLAEMPDTAAGHWTMANWCQKNQLQDQRIYHQQQVLRHDPNHAEARRGLGYTLLNGKWGKRDDRMRAQGYELHEGKYLLPQQIAILKRQRETELAEKKWRRDLKVLRGRYSGTRRVEATEQYRSINDPRAVPALQELLKSEGLADLREIYVDVLGRIGGPAAVSALISTALEDNDLEVRIRAVDHLRRMDSATAVRMISGALGSKSNRTVNRAAVALGRLGNADAILPLIDGLVTRHETIVKPTSSIAPSFSRSSDGSASMNGLGIGGGPKKVVRNLQNKSALEALVSLTKQNYQYSKRDWKQWYIRQHDAGDVNLRRDN